jgi:hypothetical protein
VHAIPSVNAALLLLTLPFCFDGRQPHVVSPELRQAYTRHDRWEGGDKMALENTASANPMYWEASANPMYWEASRQASASPMYWEASANPMYWEASRQASANPMYWEASANGSRGWSALFADPAAVAGAVRD